MDDGARNPEVSLEMLRKETADGITAVVCTPHYYMNDESPDRFLERREKAARELAAVCSADGLPDVYLGAEVYFDRNLMYSKDLVKLRIAQSRYILIEMPFRRWDESEIQALMAVRQNSGLEPIIAHIDRYADHQKRGVLEALKEDGILFQYNADYFMVKRKSEKAIFRGFVDLMGSDAHNMDDRAPNMWESSKKIVQHVNQRFFADVEERAKMILVGSEPINRGVRIEE